ncbi:MAG: RidA family protein, partial [Actinomycetota bacterium]|nr:RidA family protein [Actinomycetota bacterium]
RSDSIRLMGDEVFPGRSSNLAQHRSNPPNWSTVSEDYGEYFETPAVRSTVKVAELLMDARVEIESVAVRGS